ncbi:MAG: hypothetical protein M0Z29_07420 [Actinomycetota bacterium]|nr:hypothetical protein [Actinomycetota bacterium]
MAYDAADPRSSLGSGAHKAAAKGYGDASYVKFYETDPQLVDESSRTWLARGAYFVVAYTEAAAGAGLVRRGQADEYIVLVPDEDGKIEVGAAGESLSVSGPSLVIVPPGDSSITVAGDGRVVRIFSHLATDLAAISANASVYDSDQPNLDAYESWPAPKEGYAIRAYSLSVEPTPARFGRIWRSSNLMVNYSYPRPGPREVTKMSPHTHEGFEQGSLVLGGSFVHHVRYPWTTDMRNWRNDEHDICAGPSLAVIPPLLVHTSQQVGREINQLVDIFGPPRFDFSEMDGWVLNAEEYPMPGETA